MDLRGEPSIKRPKLQNERELVSDEDILKMLVVCARCMEMDGPAYSPIFERLESELLERRNKAEPVARAKQLLRETARYKAEMPGQMCP